ncbi:invasion associated locus B family protein [Kiloniella sp.]|uniref:invasion associated locus B family protein n=1 Tax=Kiloniella sp. TaxID=1938587 RepID=UPI003B01BAC7
MKIVKRLHTPKALLGILFSLAVLAPSASAQQAPQRTAEKYDNWTAICTTNTVKSCSIVQGIYIGDSKKPALHLAIGKLVNSSPGVTTLILTLPLGIRLPEGFSIEIGTVIKRQYRFERCIVSGCQAEIPLDAELLNNFKAMNEGRVVFLDGTKKPIALPFSLKGFTKAFNRVVQP